MHAQQQARPLWMSALLVAGALALAAMLWNAAVEPPAAFAQVPDAGAQRVQTLAELRKMNAQLAQIVQLLGEIRDQNRPEDAKQKTPPQKFTPPK